MERKIASSLQKIAFVPAKNADAHSAKPDELGFVCLNATDEVRK